MVEDISHEIEEFTTELEGTQVYKIQIYIYMNITNHTPTSVF